MKRNNFRVRLILWVAQLFVVLCALGYSLYKEQYYIAFFLGLLLAGVLVSLFRYIDRSNRDLAHFFNSIKYNDFTFESGLEEMGESFAQLSKGFSLVNQKFQEIRADKEAEHQFLQILVGHVDIGLLCINGQEEIILMNPALQKLLRKSYLVKIQGLAKVHEQLFETVQNLKPGQRELLKISIQNKLLHLSIQCVEIVLRKDPYRLISFQNIQNELEEQELISWQKLIRILTHEIMNSVAPISSLSSTLQQVIKDKETLEAQDLEKLRKSLEVIERRSEGLLGFTETYRSLTRIPLPKFEQLEANALVEQVITLFEAEIDRKQINLHKHLPVDKLSFIGDPHLLEQVLINVLKNAIEAVEDIEHPHIEVKASRNLDQKTEIQVIDNGPGIPPEKLEQVFIPFFTTKDNGSGIGLSLSRQILRMHKGGLEIRSQVGQGTIVSVWL